MIIDLLNSNKHNMREEFIHTIYSMSLFPESTRSSKMTSLCATPIDDQCLNVMKDNTVSRLLISDINFCNSSHKKIIFIESDMMGTEESMNAFRNELLAPRRLHKI